LVLLRIGECRNGPYLADRQDVDRDADQILIEQHVLDRDERRGCKAWRPVVQVDDVNATFNAVFLAALFPTQPIGGRIAGWFGLTQSA
jgi:hypothetical protein